MRNRMAHGYFSIDLDIVWETVNLDLPNLLSVLPHIIADAIAISGEGADE